jgi:hypothetical protein
VAKLAQKCVVCEKMPVFYRNFINSSVVYLLDLKGQNAKAISGRQQLICLKSQPSWSKETSETKSKIR